MNRPWLCDKRKVILGAMLAVLLGPSVAVSDPGKDGRADEKILIIGPFLLGDLYDKMPDQTLHDSPYRHVKDRISGKGGPAHADVVKAMNRCKVYIIERTRIAEEDGRRFREFVQDFPKVVVEGEAS